MGKILDRAIAALNSLPSEESERIAWEIIERLEDKSEWDCLVSSETAQRWLEQSAKQALSAYKKTAMRSSGNLISLPPSEIRIRSDSYWNCFDELPREVRVQAEKNYDLWKVEPKHASLRFKPVHRTLPIFSYRIGLRYRTVGVRADDDRVLWFWIGTFEAFEKLVGEKVGMHTT